MLETSGTYKGVALEQVARDIEKLTADFEIFEEKTAYLEHIEARVEDMKQKYRKLFAVEDDGSMPTEVQQLISLVQKFEDGRR